MELKETVKAENIKAKEQFSLGDRVQFIPPKDGKLREGTIVEMREPNHVISYQHAKVEADDGEIWFSQYSGLKKVNQEKPE